MMVRPRQQARSVSATLLALALTCGAAHGGVNTWTPSGPDGGDIESVAIDPERPQVLYAGTMAGLFASGDAGITWRVTGLTGRAVNAVAIDPGHTATLYAGTPDGVWKSGDGGDTWSATGLRTGIEILRIDPEDSRTVYAAARGSTVFKTTDGGDTWPPINAGLPDPLGVFALALAPSLPSTLYVGSGDLAFPLRRSSDGGRTWQGVPLPAPHCCVVFAIAVDPDAPTTLYVSAPPGLLKSTDGAATWDEVGAPLGADRFVALVIDPVTPTTLYALVEASGGRAYSGAVYRSADAGLTWQPTGLSGLDFRELRALALDAGATALYASTARGLLKSVDGAGSWSPTGLPAGVVANVDIAPTRPTRLYAATSFGVYRSDDRAASWLPTGLRDAAGLIVVDPGVPDTLYAVVSGGPIVKSVDAGASWGAADDGIPEHGTFALVIDPTDAQVLYAATVDGVFKTVDAAAHWTSMNAGVTYTLDSLAVAPSDPRRLYGGTYRQGVFTTRDGAATWSKTALGYGRVGAVIVDPSDADVVYAAYGGGEKSTDGGDTWSPAAFPSAFDPTDPETIYVGLSKSIDGGATFSPLPPLPLESVYSAVASIAIDASDPARLYAATYAGVFSLDQVAGMPTPTATPEPTPHAAPFVRGLTVDPPHPRVGDTIMLRFAVDAVGAPQFALEGAVPLLVFESASVTPAQEAGVVHFTLHAPTAGTAELTLSANYEFVACGDACTTERVRLAAAPFSLQIAAATSGDGGGCAIAPTRAPGVLSLALLCLPVAVPRFLRRRPIRGVGPAPCRSAARKRAVSASAAPA